MFLRGTLKFALYANIRLGFYITSDNLYLTTLPYRKEIITIPQLLVKASISRIILATYYNELFMPDGNIVVYDRVLTKNFHR